MTTILVATTNPSKLRETLAILEGLPVELRTLADYDGLQIAEESGRSFAENARQKGLHYAHATGLLTLAEDSGFEIDALDGAPGVYSARFGGEEATYPARFEEIFRRLRERGQPQSPARFVCAIALAAGGRILFETQGVVEGFVAPEPRGQQGFGYDPIFFYPPYGRTFGEVSAEEKSAVSHRGSAMRALRLFLEAQRIA